MDEPKIELRKNTERLSRLQMVRKTAAFRTKQRIALINADIAEQKAKKEGRPVFASPTKKEGK